MERRSLYVIVLVSWVNIVQLETYLCYAKGFHSFVLLMIGKNDFALHNVSFGE